MRGITEDSLRHVMKIHITNDSKTSLIFSNLFNECKELNEWQPIDENTPKYKCLLLYYPDVKDKVVAQWSHHFNYWITNFREDINLGLGEPTHWQELPKDPK